jgi:hypothetical protein
MPRGEKNPGEVRESDRSIGRPSGSAKAGRSIHSVASSPLHIPGRARVPCWSRIVGRGRHSRAGASTSAVESSAVPGRAASRQFQSAVDRGSVWSRDRRAAMRQRDAGPRQHQVLSTRHQPSQRHARSELSGQPLCEPRARGEHQRVSHRQRPPFGERRTLSAVVHLRSPVTVRSSGADRLGALKVARRASAARAETSCTECPLVGNMKRAARIPCSAQRPGSSSRAASPESYAWVGDAGGRRGKAWCELRPDGAPSPLGQVKLSAVRWNEISKAPGVVVSGVGAHSSRNTGGRAERPPARLDTSLARGSPTGRAAREPSHGTSRGA